jgi:hypothetical protein
VSANPYASPASVLETSDGSESAVLYRVGRGQKAILWLMLISLLPFVPFALRAFVGPICAVLSYRVAQHLYPPILAVIVALLCGLPLFGLVALAFLNARATKLLRSAGIRVGFMGADVSHLRAAVASHSV